MKKDILVYPSGKLVFDGKEYQCAIGKNGFTTDKKEGDWATPVGCFPLREVFYRKDRIEGIQTNLPTRETKEDDGWSDDVNDEYYNKLVKLPYRGSHEKLWREDEVYDVIVPLGYNDNPPIPGKGSAIFMHVARPTYSPTAGCVALSLHDLTELLSKVSKDTQICVVSDESVKGK
ncbi:L,D-transpeptidase family protein [Candidatus Kaiserbacteria bacterium]|nr:L,D-transpeptidase family protein [Candidatus Kaiserbacteria bacterium]